MEHVDRTVPTNTFCNLAISSSENFAIAASFSLFLDHSISFAATSRALIATVDSTLNPLSSKTSCTADINISTLSWDATEKEYQ